MRHMIIGNGIAGMTAALELARSGAGEIHVYSKEPWPYYYRPHLSDYLAGALPLERLILRPAEWYAQKGIHLHLGVTVSVVRADAHEVILQDGTRMAFDRLLYAAGSSPFVPPITGRDTRGVFTIRTLADAHAIRDHAARCRDAVVIGGGLLGLEAARGMQGLGLRVSIIELQPRLMPLQLDAQGAGILKSFVEHQGLDVHVGSRVDRIDGDGSVTGVTLADGRALPAQLVIVASGVMPNVELAREAGLEVSRGVVVDDRLRTSAPDIFAAGDAASHGGRCWAIAPAAQAQARVAAVNMAGGDAPYRDEPPVTTLKTMGIDVSSMGEIEPHGASECVHRADQGTFRYAKLLIREGRLAGAIVIGNRALAKQMESMLLRGAPLDPADAEAMLVSVGGLSS